MLLDMLLMCTGNLHGGHTGLARLSSGKGKHSAILDRCVSQGLLSVFWEGKHSAILDRCVSQCLLSGGLEEVRGSEGHPRDTDMILSP